MKLRETLILAVATFLGAIGSVALSVALPTRYEVFAKIEGNGPTWRVPLEQPRAMELRLRSIVRERTPGVTVEIETALDDRWRRMPVLEARFQSDESNGLTGAAQFALEALLYPHQELLRRRIPIYRRQLEWIDAFLGRRTDLSPEERERVEVLRSQAQAVVSSPESRVVVEPTAPAPQERRLGVRAFGGALFGLLFGAAVASLLRFGPSWSDPIGRRAFDVLRRSWGRLLAGAIIGGSIGWFGFGRSHSEIHALIEPAALDHHVPVIPSDELAVMVAREFPLARVRWVHDLSPYRMQANLLEVIGSDQALIRRAVAYVALRTDPGLAQLEKKRADSIAREGELANIDRVDAFLVRATELASALEYDQRYPTHLFAEPWREEESSHGISLSLGAALGLLAAIASEARSERSERRRVRGLSPSGTR